MAAVSSTTPSAPTPSDRPLAVVTGASSGIGLELARCCAQTGHDLLLVADEPRIVAVAAELRELGVSVDTVHADLATTDGIEQVAAAIGGRAVAALLANAGTGLGHAFLDQPFERVRHIVDTNITGTLDLVHRVGLAMRARGQGRILITGSIAGFVPGSFQAVYDASKAFLNAFSGALRNELKESGVTVTCLMPGATETGFFEHADMLDTAIGQMKKDDPADVARLGFDAMMNGEGQIVSGLKNKLLVAAARVAPPSVLAEASRRLSEPSAAKS